MDIDNIIVGIIMLIFFGRIFGRLFGMDDNSDKRKPGGGTWGGNRVPGGWTPPSEDELPPVEDTIRTYSTSTPTAHQSRPSDGYSQESDWGFDNAEKQKSDSTPTYSPPSTSRPQDLFDFGSSNTTTSNTDDKKRRIAELDSYLEQGIISRQEYNDMKRDILRGS